MAEYEVVREIENLCGNNQMRDVFFDEIETDSPVDYVREMVKGKDVEIIEDEGSDGKITIYVKSGSVTQKYLFTPI